MPRSLLAWAAGELPAVTASKAHVAVEGAAAERAASGAAAGEGEGIVRDRNSIRSRSMCVAWRVWLREGADFPLASR